MKLLFDENLSPKLPLRLTDLFPNSLHVRDVDMKSTIDPIVWDYAKSNVCDINTCAITLMGLSFTNCSKMEDSILNHFHIDLVKDTLQYCSVKKFQFGIWVGEKVKG